MGIQKNYSRDLSETIYLAKRFPYYPMALGVEP
jgi:hypothetical protein